MRFSRQPNYRPKHMADVNGDSGIYRSLGSSVVGMALCAACLCGTSWAWFTASASTEVQAIQAASYAVDVTATGANDVKSTDGGVTVSGTGTYSVTIKPSDDSTASTGYCCVKFGDVDYYTQQLDAGGITFTVNSDEGQALTITSQWGTYSGEASLKDNGVLGESTKSTDEEPQNETTAEVFSDEESSTVVEPAADTQQD